MLLWLTKFLVGRPCVLLFLEETTETKYLNFGGRETSCMKENTV